MSALREALEKQLEVLPVMTYGNGYPTQAMPKSDLLALLEQHPTEPVPAILVHLGDGEAHARHSNEGFDLAVEQFGELLKEAREDLADDATAAELLGYLDDAVKAMGGPR